MFRFKVGRCLIMTQETAQKMTKEQLLENEAAALWLMENTSSDYLRQDCIKDLTIIRKELKVKYKYNWLTKKTLN